MSALNDLEVALDSFNAEKKKFLEKAKGLIKVAFNTFFEEHPEVKIITWTQYTPYFNDGDACIFHVNEVYFSSEVLEDDNPYEYDDLNLSGYNATNKVMKESCDKFAALLNDSEEILEDMFGDHALIKVTPSAIEVLEYEHD